MKNLGFMWCWIHELILLRLALNPMPNQGVEGKQRYHKGKATYQRSAGHVTDYLCTNKPTNFDECNIDLCKPSLNSSENSQGGVQIYFLQSVDYPKTGQNFPHHF